MDAPCSFTVDLPDEDATSNVAQRLAPCLGAGDTLLLSGPIGAGKTHFARALIQRRLAKAGLAEDVPSPTFTLVQTYWDGSVEIWHADLYRLTDTSELVELGLDDALGSAIVLVEWPERMGSDRPEGALCLDFAPGATANSRKLTVTLPDPVWAKRLAGVLPATEALRD